MKNTNQIIKSGIIEQFVLGLTTDEENKQIRQYLQDFPELNEYIISVRRTMDAIVNQYDIPSREVRQMDTAKSSGKMKTWLNKMLFIMIFITLVINIFT